MAKILANKWLIIGILVTFIAVYLIGRLQAGPRTPKKIEPEDLPNSGSGIPQGWSPSTLSDRLYNDFNGINYTMEHNGELFREFATLTTDDMFVAVYLDWNRRYSSKNYPTLRRWVETETPFGWIPDADYYKGQTITRMNRLQLS